MAPDCVYFLYIADTLRPLAPIAPTLVQQYPPFSPVVGNHSEAAEEERTDGGPLSDWPTSLFPTFYWIISLSSSTLLAN